MTFTVGVDVGGTKIAVGVVDEAGHVVARDRTESPAKDPAEIVTTIGDLVRGLGLANTLTDDTARRTKILDRWARVLDAQLADPKGRTA